MQRLQRLGRRRLDRVGDGEDAADGFVDADIDGGRPVATQFIGLCRERCRINPMFGEKGGAAEHHMSAFYLANRPLASRRVEVGDIGDGDLSLLGSRHDRARKWVLRSLLHAGCEPQNSFLDKSRRSDNPGHSRFAFGQRPGLVDHQRVDLLHSLERLGVLDQNAGGRSLADTDHDRHRRREP